MLDVEQVKCGCPAGKGPFPSCKHVADLCYAFEECSCFGSVPELLTSTEKLQECNQPCPKELEIIPVTELSSRRAEILKEKNGNFSYIELIIHNHTANYCKEIECSVPSHPYTDHDFKKCQILTQLSS